MLDRIFLKTFEGPEWLTLQGAIDGLSRLDYWPSRVTRAEQIAHVREQVATLTNTDGTSCIARLRMTRDGKGAWVYKTTSSLTADDARRLYHTMHWTHPCAIVQDGHVTEFLEAHPDWQQTGVTLFHLHTADPYPLALLSRPAAVAFIAWGRRRYLTRADSRALLTALRLWPASKVSGHKGSVCHQKGQTCPVSLDPKR